MSCKRPWEWHTLFNDTKVRSENVMPLSETGLKIVKFIESLHNGDVDTVISDMVKYTNFKTLSYTAKLSIEQNGLDVVIEQYKLQRHQAAQPVTPQPSSNARLPLPVDDDASDEVPAMSDQDRLQQKE